MADVEDIALERKMQRLAFYMEKVLPTDPKGSFDIFSGDAVRPVPEISGDEKAMRKFGRSAWRIVTDPDLKVRVREINEEVTRQVQDRYRETASKRNKVSSPRFFQRTKSIASEAPIHAGVDPVRSELSDK